MRLSLQKSLPLSPILILLSLMGCTPQLNRTFTELTSSSSPTPTPSLPLSESLKIIPYSFVNSSSVGSRTFSATQGSGSGYTYSIVSGPGSINSTTGAFTVNDTFSLNLTTVVKVTDSAGNSDTATIRYIRPLLDGEVLASAADSTDVYLGGNFTSTNILPASNFFAADETSGKMNVDLRNFNSGAILRSMVISPDGAYAYVGGNFSSYQGLTANYLAKIKLSDGSLDTTFTQSTGPNGVVNALALSDDGSSLYVAGSFTQYRADPNGLRLLKMNTTNGNLDTTFNSAAVGPQTAVSSMVLSKDNASLFIGGLFTSYRGDNRGYRLAKVSATTGDLNTTFNHTATDGPSATVSAIAVSSDGTSLYIGGSFTAYRGSNKGYRLAKLNATTSALDATFNSLATTGPDSTVNTLLVSSTGLYVGGSFTQYRSSANGPYLVKVDLDSGVMNTTFNSAAQGPDGAVNALALSSDGSSLYAAGSFSNYRSTSTNGKFVKLNVSTGALDASYHPAHLGTYASVYSVAVSHSTVFVAGQFNSYWQGTSIPPLAKFDLTHWNLDTTFTQSTGPQAGSNVRALLLSGSSLFVGGDFANYRADTKGKYLAKVSKTNGNLDTTFNASAGPDNGQVRAIAQYGTALYVGGDFLSYKGDSSGTSSQLVKVNASTGALDTGFTSITAGSSELNVYALAINTAGTDLYLGGGDIISGVQNTLISKVSATDGTLDGSFNSFTQGGYSPIRALALSADEASLYVGGEFVNYPLDGSEVGSTATGNGYLVKVSSTSGNMEDPSPSTGFNHGVGANAPIYSITVSGTSVYAGGKFSSYRGSANGAHLVSLNGSTGVMNTTFNSVVGPSISTGTASVNTLGISSGSLYFGGSFDTYRENSCIPLSLYLTINASTGVENAL